MAEGCVIHHPCLLWLQGRTHATYGQSFQTCLYRVSGSSTAFNVTGLKPFTLYNVSMIARNQNGESLPTYSLRVMTHALNQGSWKKQDPSGGEVELPPLPDTRGCCLSKNITHKVF